MNMQALPDAKFFFTALSPLVAVLLISHVIWDSGEDCYTFWREWKFRHQEITTLMRFITNWGNSLAYVLYGWIFYRAIRQNRQDNLRFVLYYIAIQLIFALLITHFLKNFFGMPRPFAIIKDAQPWAFDVMSQSFPSGHTAEIVGAFLPLAVWRRRWRDAALCGLWIALVAYSRIYLGWHYLMDIWGGMVVGSLAALCILYLAGQPYDRTTRYLRGTRTGSLLTGTDPHAVRRRRTGLYRILRRSSD